MASVAFAGLGQMGGPMAANLAKGGPLLVFDKAGTAERAPQGAACAGSLEELASGAEILFLSLPDGPVVEAACRAIAAAPGRRVRLVVDLSTIGLDAAGRVAAVLSAAGLAYLDAPVSGGVAGARAASLAVMAAGPRAAYEEAAPLLARMARNLFHVGERPGQGQAMKLANNFLSATAMAATAEAVCFGEAAGLDMKTMLDVFNVSTGRNTATADKFVNRVLTGTYDAGFTASLMAKDARLYLAGAMAQDTARRMGTSVSEAWDEAEAALGSRDFTLIHRLVRDGGAP